MSELNLTIFAYGPLSTFLIQPSHLTCFDEPWRSLTFLVPTPDRNERRVEVELRPTIPESIRRNIPLVQAWSNSLVMTLGPDLKHTNAWSCEVCGKPARENEYNFFSWIHLPEPRIVIYIHHLCEAGSSPCHRIVDQQHKMMAAMAGGTPLTPPLMMDKPDGVNFPLSSSCCGCKNDSTADPSSKMSRCGACKLVRYCSPECQAGDWIRHKKICKTIKNVKWVNWD